LEGTLLVAEMVKTLCTLSGSAMPSDDEIPSLIDHDADSHLLTIRCPAAAASVPPKVVKYQVFQKIQVLIRVEEGNERQSIRKLVMTVLPDDAHAASAALAAAQRPPVQEQLEEEATPGSDLEEEEDQVAEPSPGDAKKKRKTKDGKPVKGTKKRQRR
jgi:hypothetical protein